MTEKIRDQVIYMQDNLVSLATGGHWDSTEYEYVKLREILISDKILGKNIPQFIKDKRNLEQFWQFIKHTFSTYAERRIFLWDSFGPLLSYLEAFLVNPNLDLNSTIFEKFGFEYIRTEWHKCLDRLFSDPEGAITSARTLLETTCKHILDDFGETYSDEDLPKLYDKTAKALNLSPSQHHEEIFKQILGGCKSVVFGLGALRNKMSDAHGKGYKTVKPLARHAELAVNLAGTVSIFLLKTSTESKNNPA